MRRGKLVEPLVFGQRYSSVEPKATLETTLPAGLLVTIAHNGLLTIVTNDPLIVYYGDHKMREKAKGRTFVNVTNYFEDVQLIPVRGFSCPIPLILTPLFSAIGLPSLSKWLSKRFDV